MNVVKYSLPSLPSASFVLHAKNFGKDGKSLFYQQWLARWDLDSSRHNCWWTRNRYLVVLRYWGEISDKLAERQLHPIGASQALLNCFDAPIDDQAFPLLIWDRDGVDRLHLYGDVCIVEDRVTFNVCVWSFLLVCMLWSLVTGMCYGAQPMSLSFACKGSFFWDISDKRSNMYNCHHIKHCRYSDWAVIILHRTLLLEPRTSS